MTQLSPRQAVTRLEALVDRARAHPAEFDQADYALQLAARIGDKPPSDGLQWLGLLVVLSSVVPLIAAIVDGFSATHSAETGDLSPAVMAVVKFIALALAGVGIQALGHNRTPSAAGVAKGMFQPLSDLPASCADALALVHSCAGARAIRDTVIQRGDCMRYFHLSAMRAAIQLEPTQTPTDVNRQACLELHGLSTLAH